MIIGGLKSLQEEKNASHTADDCNLPLDQTKFGTCMAYGMVWSMSV